ncbi:MAG: hypothetical protein CSA23_05690 [Deltaproteobacteria bacterium]|nr:MAG: hypothetical protein CSA23_05690 [Deltaproteobacteria bacterium]
MLANSPKDSSPSSSAETRGLYYFPEIPSREPKGDGMVPHSTNFVGGAVETPEEKEPDSSNPEDSVPVRALIDEAFAKGVAQGRAETEASQQAQVDTAVGAMQAAIESIEQLRIKDTQRMEIQTVRLAMAIARKIIGAAAGQEETIAHVVNAAMQKVSDQRQLVIRLNPADRQTVDAFKQDLLIDGDAGNQIRLEEDNTISQGGCVIETRLGDIDARIEQQIKVLEALLEAQLPQLSTDE